MKKFFYNLEFDYINSYGTEEYLDLGVFSTPKKAKDKIAKSMKLPGFDKYTLDNYKIIKFGVNVPSKDFKKENIIDITKQYVTMGGIKRIKKAHEGM